MKTKNLVLAAMLAALGLLIPIACGGFLGITIPPFFSATLAAHVPLFLSMTLGPWAAVMVAAIGAFGFLIKLGPVIAMRAASHMVFAAVGAYLYQKGWRFRNVLIVTAPIHALCEACVVLAFGFTLKDAGLVVGGGTILHHILDSIIALGLYSVLKSFLPKPKTLNA